VLKLWWRVRWGGIERGANSRYDDALVDIDRALKMGGVSVAWFGYQRAQILFLLERFDDALLQCEELKDAGGANVWYLFGKCLKKVGRFNEAREAFGNSNELGIPVGGQRGAALIKSAMEKVDDGMDVGGNEEAVNPYAE
jgi:tetratricopeptide (TPR) repeat protein